MHKHLLSACTVKKEQKKWSHNSVMESLAQLVAL